MKPKIAIFLSFFFVLSVAAVNPVKVFTDNDLLRNANVSITVKDLNTNKIKQSFRSKSATIPASTLKLVTTATALELLGPEFRFNTKLEIEGEISSDSILNGNLYIRGGGDPTLGSEILGDSDFLSTWVENVRKAGIKRINGSIVADANLYDTEGVNPKWLWEDLGNYYAAGAYGISYKDNTYILKLHSGAVGTTPELLKITPEIPGMQFKIYLKSSTITSDSAYIHGEPYSDFRSVYGAIPANKAVFEVKGDIPRPGLLLAQDFTKKLIQNGFSVRDAATDNVTTSRKCTVIYSYRSPELRDIIREINVNSNNHYAEQVFRYLSLQNDSVASSRGAVAVIKNFWKSQLLPVDELFMYDGSGLSPVDAVSSNFMVNLLAYMEKSRYNADFKASLAVAGINGTLTSFLKNTALQGKVQAKSGSIHRVKCYAGYINTDKKKYAFSIMVNNPNAATSSSTTKKMEEFLLSVSK